MFTVVNISVLRIKPCPARPVLIRLQESFKPYTVFHLALSNMAQRHVAFCGRHVALPECHFVLHECHVALLIYLDSGMPL